MGTGHVYPVRQFLPLFLSRLDSQNADNQPGKASPARPSSPPRIGRKALSDPPGLAKRLQDTPAPIQARDLAGQFDVVLFHSQLEKVAVSMQLQGLAAGLTGADGEAPVAAEGSAAAQQLAFDFFAESRTAELILFRERTNAVADNLEGKSAETYLEASRQVAVRFSMSANVSGVVLTGFAGASEGLQDADEATFDQFMAFVEDALGKVDEILNQLFELLDGLFKGDGDLAAQFKSFLEGLDLSGLLGFSEGMPAASSGEVLARSFQFQLEFSFEFSESVQIQQAKVQESDPITLDLDGDGIELTRYTEGARFDITGAGRPVTTAFVTGGDAFLAIDRNRNGIIDDGTELFGDQNGATNGFEELRTLDSNGDGVINRQDPAFDSLVLFRDNGNGITEPGELVSLAEQGIAELSLRYRHVDNRAMGGNRIAQIASFGRTDGTRGVAADVILNFTA